MTQARIILIIAVAAAFGNALNADFVWDDHALIVENQDIRDWSQLGTFFTGEFWGSAIADREQQAQLAHRYYRPLVMLSYMLDYQFYGLQAWGFHLTNTLLHLLTTLLVLRVCYWLTSGSVAIAFISALIFAVHPSRAEAVTWVSGRTDLIMALFFLIALDLLGRQLKLEERRVRYTVFGFAAFAAALLAKETAVAFAAVIPLLDALVLNRTDRRRLVQNFWRIHLPLVVITSAFIVWRLLVDTPSETGAAMMTDRVLLVLRSYRHYFAMLLNPFAPNALIGSWPAETSLALSDWAALAAITASVVAILTLRRKHPLVCWSIAFFLVVLLPTANVIPLGLKTVVAERYLYLPLIGFALALGVLIMRCSSRLRPLVFTAGILLTVLWATTIHLRSRDYFSDVQFWRQAAASNPHNPFAKQQLAYLLADDGRYDDAMPLLAQSLGEYARQQPTESVAAQLRFLQIAIKNSVQTDEAFFHAVATYLQQLGSRGPAGKKGQKLIGLNIAGTRLNFPGSEAKRTRQLAQNRSAYATLLGPILSRIGEDAAALAVLSKAATRAPDVVSLQLMLAFAHARAHDITQAREVLASAKALTGPTAQIRQAERTLELAAARVAQIRQIEPATSDRVPLLQAELYVLLKAPVRSRRWLEQAITEQPHRAEPYALLILELAAAGDHEGMAATIDRAQTKLGSSRELDALVSQAQATYDQWRGNHQPFEWAPIYAGENISTE